MSDRRGASLVLVLAAGALVASLSFVALRAAVICARLTGDLRWRTEGMLVAGTALASAAVGHRADLAALADGGSWVLTGPPRPDDWWWRIEARRRGALIRLVATARRAASDGSIYAARRASLMLARDPTDTVRVLARRARF